MVQRIVVPSIIISQINQLQVIIRNTLPFNIHNIIYIPIYTYKQKMYTTIKNNYGMISRKFLSHVKCSWVQMHNLHQTKMKQRKTAEFHSEMTRKVAVGRVRICTNLFVLVKTKSIKTGPNSPNPCETRCCLQVRNLTGELLL